jgi:two-component system, LytTR family, response regulator
MTTTVRICLIDDESLCRDTLRIFLETGCPEVTIVGEAGSLAAAVALLSKSLPDLLLLDVDLGDGTGFDLLNHFPQPSFRVIFTTAHDEFALRAFRYSAVDYLLKPVDPEELVAAVRRAILPGDASARQLQLKQLQHQASTRSFDRITLNTGSGLLFIQTTEIMRLEAQGNYSFVYLENGERHVAAQSLATFEEMLPAPPFFRAHQSHIVNTRFVRKLAKDDGDSLWMTDKAVVPLARRRKEAFMEMMG